MKRNLIHTLINSTSSIESKKRVHKHIINALTAATCSAMLSHCFAQRRGEIGGNFGNDADELTALRAGHFGGVDSRNELDAELAGEEARVHVRELQGFDPNVPAYKVAQLCDGIRYDVYELLHAFGEYPSDAVLFKSPVVGILERPNFDLPMSAELYLNMRVRMAGAVQDTDVAAICKRRPGVHEKMVRELLTDEAKRSQRRLAEILPDVLAEIGSLEDVYDVDAFMALPRGIKQRITENIERASNRDYGRMLPRSIRDLTISAECDLIEAEHKLVRAFMIELSEEEEIDPQRLAA